MQNPEVRKKLTPASWGQTQIEDCSHLVVIAALKKVDESYVHKYIQQIAKVRSTSAEALKGYEEMMVGNLVKGPRSETINFWAQRQCYIAMGFLMETAAILHIDTCPMEGLEPAKYDDILGLTGSAYATVAAVPCGYRHAEDAYQKNKKVRFEKADLIQTI